MYNNRVKGQVPPAERKSMMWDLLRVKMLPASLTERQAWMDESDVRSSSWTWFTEESRGSQREIVYLSNSQSPHNRVPRGSNCAAKPKWRRSALLTFQWGFIENTAVAKSKPILTIRKLIASPRGWWQSVTAWPDFLLTWKQRQRPYNARNAEFTRQQNSK